MTKEPTSTREAIERLVKQDPSIEAATIARELGVSRQRVVFLLGELGYELRCLWRKKGKPGK